MRGMRPLENALIIATVQEWPVIVNERLGAGMGASMAEVVPDNSGQSTFSATVPALLYCDASDMQTHFALLLLPSPAPVMTKERS